VELIFRSGSQGWIQPLTRLRFNDQNSDLQTIYIPEIDILAGDSLRLWVNEYGATYYASWNDPAPQFSLLARDVPVPWRPARGGIAVERVVSGLHLPVNLAFLPDPGPDSLDAYFYVTELYGKVKVITRNFSVITIMAEMLNFPPTGQFAGSGEMGVTGIAYYAPERALYISHVYHEDDTFFGRVIRAWLAPDRKSVTSIDVVMEYIPVAYSHQVHAVTIAPDGNLFVNTGDALLSQYAQIPGDLRGKILRMTRNGAVPPDNPFPGSYVYAIGFRNPFGAAIRPSTNALYISDNGAGVNDRIVKVVRGSNYGWCCNMAQGAVKLFTPTVAPTAITFPPPGILPSDLDGRLFMTMSGPTYDAGPSSSRGKQIWSYALNDTGAIVQSELLVHYIGNGYGTCVGLAAGQDGLYFTDLYGEKGFNQFGITNANIYRVVSSDFVGAPETPPAARSRFHLAAAPNPPRRRTTVLFEMVTPGRGDVRIFDTQGRLRRTFAPREWPAGESRVEWDGRDDNGREVASGLYFVKLSVGRESETTRVVVSR
jgi:glucose/arabinose dehydrogenase